MKTKIIISFVFLNGLALGQKDSATVAIEEIPIIQEELIEFPTVEAQFPDGTVAMKKFISENIVYPQECIEKNIQGKVYLSFIVEKNGSLTNIVVERSVFPDLDIEAKRVVSAMPNWTSGELNGKKVRTRLNLPFVFRLVDAETSEEAEITGIVSFPDQEPEFPGSLQTMRLWLNDNVHFPEELKENELSGTVYVRFVVDKSGYRGQFEILRSPNDALSKEAIRLIENMPRWTPAKHKGKDVDAWHTLLINFTMQ